MKFTAKMHGHDITGSVVNPRDYFGKTWVVEVGFGNSSLFYAVEGGNIVEVIDALTDSEEFGHIIRIEKSDERFHDRDVSRAGNAGEPVDLENVIVHGNHAKDDMIPYHAKPGCEQLLYLVADGQAPMSPIDYYNHELPD